ncbi:MAG: hypothetical protein M5U12_11610, partial [Verrucomicrobia bacterium]|nr:hypothetical protein [Verrucomicrobiota bacterium]
MDLDLDAARGQLQAHGLDLPGGRQSQDLLIQLVIVHRGQCARRGRVVTSWGNPRRNVTQRRPGGGGLSGAGRWGSR